MPLSDHSTPAKASVDGPVTVIHVAYARAEPLLCLHRLRGLCPGPGDANAVWNVTGTHGAATWPAGEPHACFVSCVVFQVLRPRRVLLLPGQPAARSDWIG